MCVFSIRWTYRYFCGTFTRPLFFKIMNTYNISVKQEFPSRWQYGLNNTDLLFDLKFVIVWNSSFTLSVLCVYTKFILPYDNKRPQNRLIKKGYIAGLNSILITNDFFHWTPSVWPEQPVHAAQHIQYDIPAMVQQQSHIWAKSWLNFTL